MAIVLGSLREGIDTSNRHWSDGGQAKRGVECRKIDLAARNSSSHGVVHHFDPPPGDSRGAAITSRRN